jgi:transcriptional regulator with XRE-family HTH domain
MTDTTPLAEYILELCKQQNMSMREASIRSGLGTETIGMIVRRGKTTTPRPGTLRLIADALSGSYQRMMILAGHAEESAEFDGVHPGVKEVIYRLIEYNHILTDIDPSGAALDEYIVMLRGQADFALALARALTRYRDDERRESPQAERGA